MRNRSLLLRLMLIFVLAVLFSEGTCPAIYAQEGGYSLKDFDFNEMRYREFTQEGSIERADWKVIYEQSFMKFDWAEMGVKSFEKLSEFDAPNALFAALAIPLSMLNAAAENSYAGSYRVIVEESMGERRYTIAQRRIEYTTFHLEGIAMWVPLSAGEAAMAFLEMGYKPPDALWKQDISSSLKEFQDKFPEQWSAFEDWRSKYKPSSVQPPNHHDGNGGPGGQSMDPTKELWFDFWNATQFQDDLGGIDFTSIQLNYISTHCNASGESDFRFVLKGLRAGENDKTIDLEDAAEFSTKSFFIGLAIPNNTFWVNLNPWEADRIIDGVLAATDVGRIMLEADLQMKRDFCRYENPGQSEIGKQCWQLLEEKQEQLISAIMKDYPGEIESTNNVLFVPVIRHWIVPGKFTVYQSDNDISVADYTLDIYSEPVDQYSSYQLVNQRSVSTRCAEALSEAAKEFGAFTKEQSDEMILPLVVKEVNTGENYSRLREAYVAIALARWYKEKYRGGFGIFSSLIDSRNLGQLESEQRWDPKEIWKTYVRSYQQGEYCYETSRTYPQDGYMVTETKVYSSGGVDFANIPITDIGTLSPDFRKLVAKAVQYADVSERDYYLFGVGLIRQNTDETISPTAQLAPDSKKTTPGEDQTTPVTKAIFIGIGLSVLAFSGIFTLIKKVRQT